MENAANNLVGGIAVYFLIIVGCAYVFDCGMKIHDWFRKHFPKKESTDTRKKMSEAMKGKPAHNKGKHCHLENGKRVYPIL